MNRPVDRQHAYRPGGFLRNRLYMNMLLKMIHCASIDTYACNEIVRMRREEGLEMIAEVETWSII